MDPDFDPSSLVDEDHFLNNIEISHLFVEDFETLEGGFDHVELISHGNIVDFLQPKVNFLDIEETFVDGRAQIHHRYVDESLDSVYVG